MKKLFFSLPSMAGRTRFVAWGNPGNAGVRCGHGVTQRDRPSPIDPTDFQFNLRGFLAQPAVLVSQYRPVAPARAFPGQTSTLIESQPPPHGLPARGPWVNIPGKVRFASTRLNLC